MKRFCLLILLLLLALLKDGGQAIASKHADLSVMAEIVHAVKSDERLVYAPQFIPYLKLNISNKTSHPRNITIMSCGWSDSWVQKGAYGLCASWGCDKNSPITITIPVGQALVFYSTLCAAQRGESGASSFSMGFIDFPEDYFFSWHRS